MSATTLADRIERRRALAVVCPACDAPPKRYCRKWLVTKSRWEPYKPRHLHKVRIDAGHRSVLKRKVAVDIETTGLNPWQPDPDKPLAGANLTSHLDSARAEAHKMCLGMLHVPCEHAAGRRPHHPLENTIAAALVAALYRGRGGRR